MRHPATTLIHRIGATSVHLSDHQICSLNHMEMIHTDLRLRQVPRIALWNDEDMSIAMYSMRWRQYRGRDFNHRFTAVPRRPSTIPRNFPVSRSASTNDHSSIRMTITVLPCTCVPDFAELVLMDAQAPENMRFASPSNSPTLFSCAMTVGRTPHAPQQFERQHAVRYSSDLQVVGRAVW